jgi:hypothetical protein
MATLAESFKEPPKIFSPVPIWWWSGEPILKERLRWQMERLVEAGVFNVPHHEPRSQRSTFRQRP